MNKISNKDKYGKLMFFIGKYLVMPLICLGCVPDFIVKSAFYLVIPLICLGCVPEPISPPKLFPPFFAIGDVVRVTESSGTECGYVTRRIEMVGNCWNYEIMFQQGNINYREQDISLIKRAIWYDESKPLPAAENKPLPAAETIKEKDFNFLEGEK